MMRRPLRERTPVLYNENELARATVCSQSSGTEVRTWHYIIAIRHARVLRCAEGSHFDRFARMQAVLPAVDGGASGCPMPRVYQMTLTLAGHAQ